MYYFECQTINTIIMKNKISFAELMQQNGFQHLGKTTYDGYPLKVEYYLTDRGRKIFEAVTIMQSVGIDMMTEDGREDFLREKGLL